MGECLICQEIIQKCNQVCLKNEDQPHNSNCQGIFCDSCMNLWSDKSRDCPACRQPYTFIYSDSFQKYIDPTKKLEIDPQPYTDEELLFQTLDYEEQHRESDIVPASQSAWFLDETDRDFFLDDVLDSLSFLSFEEKIYDLSILKTKTDSILPALYHSSSDRRQKIADVLKTWWLRYRQITAGRRKCKICCGFFHNSANCVFRSLSNPIEYRQNQELLQQQLRAYGHLKLRNYV